MKKLIDSADTIVRDSLAGFALIHPAVIWVDLENLTTYRVPDAADRTVAVVSGGGAGHEPLHAGFVGPGMLDAAVSGDIFASPNADQISAAIIKADRGAGVLIVVKNYTGDVINFRIGAELAEEHGTHTRSVVVADDVAIPRGQTNPGRRGTGATVFVEKIAGAASRAGWSLDEVARVARKSAESAGSLAVALTSCITPMSGEPTFDLGANEVEFGVGIHGEAGISRQPVRTAQELAAEMMGRILDDLGAGPSTSVLLLTNSLGATPDSELHIMHKGAVDLAASRGVSVDRHLVGRYVTSLDMAGVSFSVLRLDEELLALWDAPVHTPALVNGARA